MPFAENFATLKENKVIPDNQLDGQLTPEAIDAITNLTQEQIDFLIQVSTATQSYIYLSPQGNDITICGF